MRMRHFTKQTETGVIEHTFPSSGSERHTALCYVFPFLLFSVLNFAHRAFDAFEIFALAAADITRFLT
jgi:hypothetical protein